jgi:hypothetical protein
MTEAPSPPTLHDIVLPEPVSWMPQTVGWRVLLAVLLVSLVWVSWTAIRRRRANRYRRLALTRLEESERALADPASRAGAISDLPVLVKQTALACRPRSEVASLSGDRWLRFLDESYDGSGFTKGPGRLLPALAYEAPRVEEGEEGIGDLVRLIRHWIRSHDSSTPRTPSTVSEEPGVRV